MPVQKHRHVCTKNKHMPAHKYRYDCARKQIFYYKKYIHMSVQKTLMCRYKLTDIYACQKKKKLTDMPIQN